MDRFEYTSPLLMQNENTLMGAKNVRIYDGDQKVRA